MYIPEIYNNTDMDKINQFIRANSFADLVTVNEGKVSSNKVPFLYNEEEGVLYGHFGKTNPQLAELELCPEVLVIFSGADAYISPHWYVSKNLVPTWNFQSLQVRGKARTVDKAGLLEILTKLTEFHEAKLQAPWSIDSLPPESLEMMLNMIVGFEIQISDIKFKEKMSQNRSAEDRSSIIAILKDQSCGVSPEDRVSQLMKDSLENS